MDGLGETTMITWAERGLKIENTDETTESLAVYVPVPEHSYKGSAKDPEMAVMGLTKRFKTVMIETGVECLTVKTRVRVGEYWAREMASSANIEMRKNIYGSQY